MPLPPAAPDPEPTMIGYYLHLALRSFGRNKILTTLMVLAVALGILSLIHI